MNHNNFLYHVSAIKAIEKNAIVRCGIDEVTLMERAGAAAYKYLHQHWPAAQNIAVICGKGNNGGDGYVVARLAHKAGLKVTVFQMCPTDALQGAAKTAALACEKAKVQILPFQRDLILTMDLIVDALLGTGVNSEIRAEYRDAIALMNATPVPKFALDIPSGLDANDGKLWGVAVEAAATMTFVAYKSGLFTGAGPQCTGEIVSDDLGISELAYAEIMPAANLIPLSDVMAALPPRPRSAHKGKFGHTLVIGGDYGMVGAVRMAAEAAARVGSGLTSVATRPEHVNAISEARPELMCHGINEITQLMPLLEKATVIVLGPGLGQSEWSQTLFNAAIAASQPKVVDADGLNLLTKKPIKNDNWILTPHPGEASRLLNIPTQQIQENRYWAAQNLQQQYGGVCVLKGAGTIIQAAEELPSVCVAGNPGMASGGMGDILSGVIGGLVAQGLPLPTAAKIGVTVHSHAADRAALEGGERGLLALDLMPYLRRLVNP